MNVRRIVMGAVLAVLALSPVCALAQGRGHRMGTRSGIGHERGSMMQMEGMMQQMGGIMQQMAERIKAGPMPPDQTLQMSEMMGQMAVMMNKMPGMMGGGGAGSGGQSGGMPSFDTPTQLGGMMERLTEMQKRMATLLVPPQPAPQAAPQPAKP